MIYRSNSKPSAPELNELIFDRIGRTSIARACDIARDLQLDVPTVLISLLALKNHELVGECPSPGGDALSVYFITANGLRHMRDRRVDI